MAFGRKPTIVASDGGVSPRSLEVPTSFGHVMKVICCSVSSEISLAAASHDTSDPPNSCNPSLLWKNR